MNQRKLLPLYLISFQNVIGFTLLIPVLPFVVQKYGGGSFIYGFILATYAICQFLATPILGTLSDRYGRKPLLLISFAGTLIGWAIFCLSAFVPQVVVFGMQLPLWIILIAQIIDGITGGNISIAGAYAADVSKPHERSKIYSMFGALFGVGFVIGPALGGIVAQGPAGYLGVGLLAFLITLITVLAIIFFLPESLEPHKRRFIPLIDAFKKINVIAGVAQYRKKAGIPTLLVGRFIYALAFAMLNVAFTVYAQKYLHLNETQLGVLFFMVGIMVVINQGFIARHVTKKTSEKTAFFLGQIVFAVVAFAYIFEPNLWQTLVIMAFLTFASALSIPTSRALLSTLADEHEQGELGGLDESLNALTRAIGPLVAGFLYETTNHWSFGIIALIFVFSQALWLVPRRKTLA